jgi:hypothetical protein
MSISVGNETMKSKPETRSQAARQIPDDDANMRKPPDGDTEPDEMPDDDLSDLDDCAVAVADDDRWEVFLLDDDETDPLPEYGDFWFPD